MDVGDEGTGSGAIALLVVISLLLEDEALAKTCALNFPRPIAEQEMKYKDKPDQINVFREKIVMTCTLKIEADAGNGCMTNQLNSA